MYYAQNKYWNSLIQVIRKTDNHEFTVTTEPLAVPVVTEEEQDQAATKLL